MRLRRTDIDRLLAEVAALGPDGAALVGRFRADHSAGRRRKSGLAYRAAARLWRRFYRKNNQLLVEQSLPKFLRGHHHTLAWAQRGRGLPLDPRSQPTALYGPGNDSLAGWGPWRVVGKLPLVQHASGPEVHFEEVLGEGPGVVEGLNEAAR
jgi:hypothetical protein